MADERVYVRGNYEFYFQNGTFARIKQKEYIIKNVPAPTKEYRLHFPYPSKFMPHLNKIEIENVEHLAGGFLYNQLHTHTNTQNSKLRNHFQLN